MKKYLTLSIIVILIASCTDKGNKGDGYGYRFLPRKVSYIITVVGTQTLKYSSIDGKPYLQYGRMEEDFVRNNEWNLSIGTLNFNPDTLQNWGLFFTLIDTPIPEVQRQLVQEYEYQKKINDQYAGSSKGQDAFNWVDIDYRISPVLNLTVYALKTPLFGKQAGESLNDFFDIVGHNPAVFSTPSYRLVHSSANKDPIPLYEWLSLRPLAQVGMNIVPNKPLSGLPLDVQFIVEMETGEGLVLRDTTRVFTITE
jgi:hypothetical protein